MSDNDSPEIPKGPDPIEPTQPRSVWDTFNRPRQKITRDEGDPNYVPGQETAPPTDEELMRAAAVKCAEMEDEIEELLKEAAENPTRSNAFTIFQENNQLSLTITDEGFWTSGKDAETSYFGSQPISPTAPIYFRISNDQAHTSNLDKRELEITGFVSDEPTQDAYNKLAQNKYFIPIFTGTSYFFNIDGSYRKVVQLPKKIVDSRRRQIEVPKGYLGVHKKSANNPENIDLSTGFGSYESEMTPHDFEIAGQALTMLKNRLLEAQGQAPPESQQ